MPFEAPQTIYGMAILYGNHEGAGGERLATEIFTVRGEAPLTRDEAVDRADAAIRQRLGLSPAAYILRSAGSIIIQSEC